MRSLAVVCIFLASLPIATAQMSHEETIVRTAYARMSYAVDIGTAYRAVLTNHNLTTADLAKQISERGLTFKLSDFTVGNVSDIINVNYSGYFSQLPAGEEMIHTRVRTESFKELSGDGTSPANPVSMEALDAEWGVGLVPESGGNDPIAGYTMKDMIPIIENELQMPSVDRYCAYSATVFSGGRSRSYKAVFFFANSGEFAPVDPAVGSDGNRLSYFMSHPVFPGILTKTTLSMLPAVHDFLATNQKTATAQNACKSGDACCDGTTLQCGVLSSDLGRHP